MIGRKFKAKEKEKILRECEDAEWKTRRVKQVARIKNCHWVTIYNWRKRYDGTLASITNKPPNNYQPRQHTAEQTEILRHALDNNPKVGRMQLYARLRLEMGYIYCIRTMDREMRRQGFIVPPTEKIKAELHPYDTPDTIGIKWQIDVKCVPSCCLLNIPDSAYYYSSGGQRFYQYTCIDEASRKRFMYIYDRCNKDTTVDFMKRCIIFFGYKPLVVQTDNGFEFCNFAEVKGIKVHKRKNDKYLHAFTEFLYKQGIQHNLIKVATPRHNGKVERSHRTDNEEFYIYYTEQNGFRNLAHARECQKEWVFRYNNRRVMSVLKYRTPQETENILITQLRQNCGRVTYIDIEHQKGSGHRPQKVEREGTVRFMPQDINWAFAARPI